MLSQWCLTIPVGTSNVDFYVDCLHKVGHFISKLCAGILYRPQTKHHCAVTNKQITYPQPGCRSEAAFLLLPGEQASREVWELLGWWPVDVGWWGRARGSNKIPIFWHFPPSLLVPLPPILFVVLSCFLLWLYCFSSQLGGLSIGLDLFQWRLCTSLCHLGDPLKGLG